jgi:hypothetical protein
MEGQQTARLSLTDRLEKGGPLLTVKTEVNGDAKRQMKGVLFGLFVGLVVPV